MFISKKKLKTLEERIERLEARNKFDVFNDGSVGYETMSVRDVLYYLIDYMGISIRRTSPQITITKTKTKKGG